MLFRSPFAMSVTTVDRTSTYRNLKRVKGICVSSLMTPEIKTEIPECVAWKYIPSACDEVPSPQEVAQIDGLGHLAKSFPEKKDSWKTILLVGRDCIWLHETLQQIRPITPAGPMADLTHLGWTLIGPKVAAPLSKKTGIYQTQSYLPELNILMTLPTRLLSPIPRFQSCQDVEDRSEEHTSELQSQ